MDFHTKLTEPEGNKRQLFIHIPMNVHLASWSSNVHETWSNVHENPELRGYRDSAW